MDKSGTIFTLRANNQHRAVFFNLEDLQSLLDELCTQADAHPLIVMEHSPTAQVPEYAVPSLAWTKRLNQLRLQSAHAADTTRQHLLAQHLAVEALENTVTAAQTAHDKAVHALERETAAAESQGVHRCSICHLWMNTAPAYQKAQARLRKGRSSTESTGSRVTVDEDDSDEDDVTGGGHRLQLARAAAKELVMELGCKHVFHQACLHRWLVVDSASASTISTHHNHSAAKTCPLCRVNPSRLLGTCTSCRRVHEGVYLGIHAGRNWVYLDVNNYVGNTHTLPEYVFSVSMCRPATSSDIRCLECTNL